MFAYQKLMDSKKNVTPVNPGSGSGAGSGVRGFHKSLNRYRFRLQLIPAPWAGAGMT